ncbi:MAG: hypothetical protein KI793_11040 [Rivularia sp. (in: Bacteria)]|nr:hypothetical protein [Rivularia sp. MS3]
MMLLVRFNVLCILVLKLISLFDASPAYKAGLRLHENNPKVSSPQLNTDLEYQINKIIGSSVVSMLNSE